MQRKNIEDVNVIIVAAGSSSRFKGKTRKVFFKIAGIPIIVHSIRNFVSLFKQEDIIVVARKDDMKNMKNTLKKYSLSSVKICEGGSERAISVLNGLIESKKEKVLIHDGARFFIPAKTLIDIISNLKEESSCIAPAYSPSETVRILKNKKYEILDRNNLFLMQTPQACYRNKYIRILRKQLRKNKYFTDDAEYFVKENLKLIFVKGDKRNLKITTLHDTVLAEEIIKKGD